MLRRQFAFSNITVLKYKLYVFSITMLDPLSDVCERSDETIHISEKCKKLSISTNKSISKDGNLKHDFDSPGTKFTTHNKLKLITGNGESKVSQVNDLHSNSYGEKQTGETKIVQPTFRSTDEDLKKGKVKGRKKRTSVKNKIEKIFPSNSSVPQMSKLSYKRKSPRLGTSPYWNRKKNLNKRPIGRPRKHFDNIPNKVSKERDDDNENIDTISCSNMLENEKKGKSQTQSKNQKSEEKQSLNTDNEEEEMSVSRNIKRKRGRPKSAKKTAKKREAELLKKTVMDTNKSRTLGTGVSFKTKGKPKLYRAATKQLITYTPARVVSNSRMFVQHVNCLNEKIKLPKCRECRKASYNRSTWDMVNSYCRFLEYRKLFASEDGTILCAGFLQPSDSTAADKSMWLPNLVHPPEDLTFDTSKELLLQVGDQFCDLVQQEKEALSLHLGPGKNMTWKKLVQGVREMCDVCDTTLFNIHWVCHKCGFAVCIDCYKVRMQDIMIADDESQVKGRDDYLWLFCHNRVPHEQDQLILAQMVPGDALWTMSNTLHKVREKWNITAYCTCSSQENIKTSDSSVSTGICKQLMSTVSKSFPTVSVTNNTPSSISFSLNPSSLDIAIPDSALKWLVDVNVEETALNFESDKMHTCYKENVSSEANDDTDENFYCMSKVIKYVKTSKKEVRSSNNDTLDYFNRRYPHPSRGRKPLPVRIFTFIESNIPFENISHSWLCNGRLLLLHRPDHSGNLELFQEQWKRGQPIVVKGVNKKLDMSLWCPDGFCRDFGDIVNDLVDCRTGTIIPNLPMKKFWLGFENLGERIKDDSGDYMLLKLKDWPPGEDFSEKLPKRFQDLMKGLPLPEYTHRDGIFNLAARLPSWFVRPDLGPKMYNAYGSALYPAKGTTNLHLDISDAVNVMVYVGIPHDIDYEQHIDEALKAIDQGGCDSLTKERVRLKGVRPGALWHIYDSRNADRIRKFLAKVAIERGEKLEIHHDPIHDQSWYLDAELRKRLCVEYGVQGYAIAQCLGDAVFIPAGAPHQVRNLHSCVKVAEDFVSPENIAHCFKLTQEFRHLSDTHTNHEDKLQIKNIIYHVVKDALSHLI